MTQQRMLVALWMRSSAGADPGTIDQRLKALGEAVELAEACRVRYVADYHDDWCKPQVLFVAPEYLFGIPDPPTKNRKTEERPKRHLDEPEANRVLASLKALSLRYPKIAMIPGTIAWYKTLGDYRKLQKSHPERAPDPSRVLQEAHDSITRQPKVYGPQKAAAEDTSDKGIVAKNIGKASDWKSKSDELAKGGDNMYLCLNTAVVLWNGEVVNVYHKHGDFEELKPDQGVVMNEIAFPGRKDGTFKLGHLSCGIEICFDHSLNVLARALAKTPTKHRPHLHIITSAWVAVEGGDLNVRDGGHVVAVAPIEFGIEKGRDSHNNKVQTVRQPSGVWQVRAGIKQLVPEAHWKDGTPVVHEDVAGGAFRLYPIRTGG